MKKTAVTPCSIGQERLRYWGEAVKVGVTTGNDEQKYVELRELMPYYWGKAYK